MTSDRLNNIALLSTENTWDERIDFRYFIDDFATHDNYRIKLF